MEKSENTGNMEKEILGKSIIYSFSLYARIFVKLVSGLFIAKLLGPSLFGLKNAYDLAMEYESNSDLGTFNALNRMAPYYRGAKEHDKASGAIGSVFCVNLYYAATVAVVLIIVSRYLEYSGFEQQYVDFMLFLGLTVLTKKIYLFLQTKLKIDHRFYELSVNQLLYGITAAGLSVTFVIFWGFRGVLAGLLAADVIGIGHLLTKERRLPALKISFSLYWQLLKIGFPMMVLFLLIMLLANLDRTLILAMISEKALGFFGIATVASGVVLTIPGAVHSVTLAPVMEKLGRTRDALAIRHYLNEPMVLMAYILPVFIACIYFAVHLPLRYYLDQYGPSIQVIQILVIGTYFQSVASPVLSVCLALNKQVRLIGLVIPMVALNFVLNYAFIRAGWGINGVAAGTSITFFVSFCLLLYFSSLLFQDNISTYFKDVAIVFLPFAYSCVLIFCIEMFIDFPIHGLWLDMGVTLGKIFVFMLGYSLLLYRLRRHSGFVKLYANLRILLENFRHRKTCL